jgi:hypothetical protein
MRVQLTDRFCDRAKAAEGQIQTDYFDAKVPGLGLRVGHRGKSWTLLYLQGGKRKRLTFGPYPAISLAEARRKALEAKATIAEGHAPSASKGDTLRAVCEEYLGRTQQRSRDYYADTLARLAYPTLGDRPIGDIRRSEIVRLLDRIEDENGPVMADMVLAMVRRVMNWHASRSDEFRSPIVRGMARTKPHERARKRILSDDELRKVWNTEGTLGPLVRFILLTSARRTEASEMTWDEVEGSEWCLPTARNKTKVDLLRPLSGAAMEILAAMKSNVEGPFVFPKGSLSALKKDFDAACGVVGWTLHDCRRTARSLMSRAGVGSDHAERCLGHVIGGVRGVYDRHEYREEKRQAFEALASLVTRIVNPQPNVVPMRGSAHAE